MKNFLIIIISIFLLITSFSVWYYLLVKLPEYNNSKIEFEKQKYNDEQERIRQKEIQTTLERESKEREKEDKKNKLDECLKDTSINYIMSWNTECKIYKSEYSSLYKEDWNWSCLLPTNKADRIEETQKEQKDECYKRYWN